MLHSNISDFSMLARRVKEGPLREAPWEKECTENAGISEGFYVFFAMDRASHKRVNPM